MAPTADLPHHPGASIPYQKGWRLHVILFAMFAGLFLSALETTIIATALVSISSDLGRFASAAWIPVSYLITYTGFLVVVARLSDIFGRKSMVILSVAFFMVFSAACGGAKTMTELIVFRAFQGVGAGGIYASVMGSLQEVSPPGTFGALTGIIGGVLALSSVLGPVLGGYIVASTTWRWVFWLNLPVCAIIIFILILLFPSPTSPTCNAPRSSAAAPTKLAKVKQVDYPGALLSLAACSTLIYAFESAAQSFRWNTHAIIVTLVASGILWVSFVFWEFHLSHSISSESTSTTTTSTIGAKYTLPLFPSHLLRTRVPSLTLLSAFLSGFPFFVLVVTLPQLYQIESLLSPSAAATHLIPLLVSSAAGASVAGLLCARWPVDWYVLLGAGICQLAGMALFAWDMRFAEKVKAKEMGFEVLVGVGLGSYTTTIILTGRAAVTGRDQAVTIGALTQLRTLGGAIGLAISQVVLFHSLHASLTASHFTSTELVSFLQSPASALAHLPPDKALALRHAFGKGFSTQVRSVMWFTAAAIISSAGTWTKGAVTLERKIQLLVAQEERKMRQTEARQADAEEETGAEKECKDAKAAENAIGPVFSQANADEQEAIQHE